MSMSGLEPLRYIVLPGKNPAPQFRGAYGRAFDLWMDVWSREILKLDGVSLTSSDHFSRQDLIGALFQGDTCLGLTCFSILDLSLPASRMDSWFQPWPDALVLDLSRKANRYLCMSWFTVAPEWRREKRGATLAVSRIVAELSSLLTLAEGIPALGTPRCDRSINRLAEAVGGELLLQGVKHHGVEIALVVFEPTNIEVTKETFSLDARSLWENRMDYRQGGPSSQMRAKYEVNMQRYGAACQKYPFEDSSFYTLYLAQTYYFVRHSIRLLGLAIARMDHEHAAFSGRFATSLSEEHGHELLALNDLKLLAKTITGLPELPETRALYECQYYKIEYQHPLALLGYVIFLEGLAAISAAPVLDRVRSTFGDACSFLKVHCEDDVEHVEKALCLTDGLSKPIADLVKTNFEQTAVLFFHMFDAIRAKASQSASLVLE